MRLQIKYKKGKKKKKNNYRKCKHVEAKQYAS